MNEKTTKLKTYLFLNGLIVLFSLSAVLSKLASKEILFSLPFLFYYGSVLIIMFMYAIGWQKILSKFNLNTAYAFRSLLVFWGLLWGMLFFQETLTFNKILGVLIVFLGLVWVNKDE